MTAPASSTASAPSASSAASTGRRTAATGRLPSRRILWAGLAAAAIALLAVATVDQGGAESDSERIQRLSESFACPVCSGESVAESNAAVAANIRDVIAEQVGSEASDQEIRDDLVRAYGVEVLLNPPAEGLAQLLWVLPVVLLVTGTVAVVAVIDRNRTPAPVDDADRVLVEQALTAWRQRRATSTAGPVPPDAPGSRPAAGAPVGAGTVDAGPEGGAVAGAGLDDPVGDGTGNDAGAAGEADGGGADRSGGPTADQDGFEIRSGDPS